MKRQLLSMALVCTMLFALLATAIPLSATEITADPSPKAAVATPLAETDENLHRAFENTMVPFVDYMSNTMVFTSYDVEAPNESIIWQYVMKQHLDEFRDFIRFDDEYVEYINEKYYIPVDVFEEYVAQRFVVTDELIERLHICEAYTLDGDEYVYFYQHNGGSGGPRDVVVYHGYKQLTDNTYALYAYTVDMMEPIPDEDMTDLHEGVDYVTVDDPDIGAANYYITGDYVMTVEYNGENALCMTFDPADTPVLREEGIIVPEASEGDDTTGGDNTGSDTPPEEELPYTFEFTSGITVNAQYTTEKTGSNGQPYTAYDWVLRGECTVIVDLTDDSYEDNEPWTCKPIQISDRYGVHYGYEFEFIDDQETEAWVPGNTYDAQIVLRSIDSGEVADVIDVRVTVTPYVPPVIQIVSPITVKEEYFEIGMDILGLPAIYYQWFTLGECDMIINLPEEGYENFEYHGSIMRAYERFFASAGYEIDYHDNQEADSWMAGKTYGANVALYSPDSEDKPLNLDVMVSVKDTVDFMLASGIQVNDRNLQLSADKDGKLFAYFDWTQAYVSGIVGNSFYADYPLEDLIDFYREFVGEDNFIGADFLDNQSSANQWTSEEDADGEQSRLASLIIHYYNKDGDPASQEADVYVEVVGDFTAEDLTIERIDVKPIFYYEGDEPGANIKVVFKGGLHLDVNYVEAEWPTEPGEYTVTLAVLGSKQTVEATVTVMEASNSGKCGDNMEWSFDEATGTLTISGTGDMYTIVESYKDATSGDFLFEPFWWRLPVKHIVVKSGVEGIADFAFLQPYNKNYELLESVQLPKTLKALPEMGLLFSTKMTTFKIPEGIKSVTGWIFGVPGNTATVIEELYLPSTITEIDIVTLVLAGLDVNTGEATLSKIHFCGTEEEWNAIDRVRHPVFDEIFGIKDGDTELYQKYEEVFAQIEIVFEPKEEIKVDENGTATLPDSAVDIVEGEDIVIDVTAPSVDNGEGGEGGEGSEGGDIPVPEAPKAESVVIGSATVDKIVDANTNVEIKLPDASVSFDADAFTSIGEQAAGKDVTIVVKEVEKETLNEEQKEALIEKEVVTVINLEAIVENTNITEFGGGKVTVSVPFEVPAGKSSDAFYVAYIADDGTITVMPTTYKDGALCFETTHFSSYAVLERTAGNPNTGDSTSVLVLTVLLSASLLCLAVVNRRKVNAR